MGRFLVGDGRHYQHVIDPPLRETARKVDEPLWTKADGSTDGPSSEHPDQAGDTAR